MCASRARPELQELWAQPVVQRLPILLQGADIYLEEGVQILQVGLLFFGRQGERLALPGSDPFGLEAIHAQGGEEPHGFWERPSTPNHRTPQQFHVPLREEVIQVLFDHIEASPPIAEDAGLIVDSCGPSMLKKTVKRCSSRNRRSEG
jgi:hypothetical protein